MNQQPIDDLLTPRLVLRSLSLPVLEAWLAQDEPRVVSLLGLQLPDEWREERPFIELRRNDCLQDPAYAPWSLRALGLRESGEMIGHIGFHTRPDPDYLRPYTPHGVELGYTVYAKHRRQGYAEEAIAGLLAWAYNAHNVRCFVISVAPHNEPSRKLAAKLGFQRIGGHEDNVDGYEDIYSLSGEALTRLAERAKVEVGSNLQQGAPMDEGFDLDESLVEVYRAANAPQAHVVCDRLEAEGIPARVDGDFLQGALGGLPVGWSASPRVLVAESYAKKARQIIAAIEREKTLEQSDFED
jgi:RimJ/RimL family protein N-acetyltransferase